MTVKKLFYSLKFCVSCLTSSTFWTTLNFWIATPLDSKRALLWYSNRFRFRIWVAATWEGEKNNNNNPLVTISVTTIKVQYCAGNKLNFNVFQFFHLWYYLEFLMGRYYTIINFSPQSVQISSLDTVTWSSGWSEFQTQ